MNGSLNPCELRALVFLNSYKNSGGKAGSPAGQPRWGANPALPTQSFTLLTAMLKLGRLSRGPTTVNQESLSGWEGGLAPALGYINPEDSIEQHARVQRFGPLDRREQAEKL